jgi:hypothetical protein
MSQKLKRLLFQLIVKQRTPDNFLNYCQQKKNEIGPHPKRIRHNGHAPTPTIAPAINPTRKLVTNPSAFDFAHND